MTTVDQQTHAELLHLLVTACAHARRDMQIIIPIVESGAGMSASSLRNRLGLINKAIVAAGKAGLIQEKA